MESIQSVTQTSYQRTNAECLAALRSQGPERDRAFADLRISLLRGVLIYLRRHRNKLQLDRNELVQLAEACAEEALVITETKLGTFRGDSRFTTWACRVAIKVAAGELHFLFREELTLDDADTRLELFTHLPATSGAPVADREMIETLNHLIPELLTDQQQRVLALQIQGIPLEVIAERFNTNPKVLYKVLHDTRRQLKQSLLDVHGT